MLIFMGERIAIQKKVAIQQKRARGGALSELDRFGRSLGGLFGPHVFGHFAGLHTGGANGDPLGGAVDHGADRLEIRIPAPPGGVVGVRDVIAEHRLFAAYFTNFGHIQTHFPLGQVAHQFIDYFGKGKAKVEGIIDGHLWDRIYKSLNNRHIDSGLGSHITFVVFMNLR